MNAFFTRSEKKGDRVYMAAVGLLVVVGLLIFLSASLGLLIKPNGPSFWSVISNQIILGFLLGLVLFVAASKIPYKFWRRISLFIFLAALAVNLLLFIPNIGVMHGGATRWINVFGVSFQPSDFLKFGFILYFAAWLSSVRDKIQTLRYGLIPLLIFFTLTTVLLVGQRDTDTMIVIITTGMMMFFVSGGRIRDILTVSLIGLIGLILLASFRPYILARLNTFINPDFDPAGSSYQIQQSLIAVGSGEWTGRGFGQSIQKFKYLPEPTGDSVFAVAAEEFGFVGSTILILLFVLFAMRGFKIAMRAPDSYSSLAATGIIFLIIFQSFVNISSMLAIVPLSGIPLLFISRGGTALVFTLIEAGIVLNISKYSRP